MRSQGEECFKENEREKEVVTVFSLSLLRVFPVNQVSRGTRKTCDLLLRFSSLRHLLGGDILMNKLAVGA